MTETKTKNHVKPLNNQRKNMKSCTWSPDDNIYSTGDGSYNLNTGSEEANLTAVSAVLRFRDSDINLQETYWTLIKSFQEFFDNHPEEMERMRKFDFNDPNNQYHQLFGGYK